MTCRPRSTLPALALLFATLGACGNYSNEDLEFMNAVPAREDLSANIPRSMILPANEAELSRDTHNVVKAFNGALDFLTAADTIRAYQPTTRIPDGRIWGPVPMADHLGWQWRFRMTRDPSAPETFNYAFEIERIGGSESEWIAFIHGDFTSTGGARRGTGHFVMEADGLRNAGYLIQPDGDGNWFKSLSVSYSTADYPINVMMMLVLYPKGDVTNMIGIMYTYEQQSNGQGAMAFSGTDSTTGRSLQITSRWLASGRGRADATGQDGLGNQATWTECWNDSFVSVYDNKPWATPPEPVTSGDPSFCPDIPTL
jgi:hypothetical protein